LAAIASLPLHRTVRILNLCGDQERIITLSEMRKLLPREVELVPGPGCAASLCPQDDLHQALALVERHDLTLLVEENLLRMPLDRVGDAVGSLYDAAREGADIWGVEGPVRAVQAARERPRREFVYFAAGFETLVVPLAGMILDGLPDNLSILLCGRRAEPVVEALLADGSNAIDALLLPGNRCALTGLFEWDRVAREYRKPAAVAGYSTVGILTALHALLLQHINGAARVDNFYRVMVRPEGNRMAVDQLDRVFERDVGGWRGMGVVADTAFRLRRAYDGINADKRFGDYRDEIGNVHGMPRSCSCGEILGGRQMPVRCPHFATACSPLYPVGPCMASTDGTCFLHRSDRTAAAQ
jgi:hydrogenase expression/formation protein HypD